MKKVVIISLLAQILWGSDDYLPVSKLTDEKKYEYGFLNKENQKEIVKAKNNINDDGYEPIKEIKIDVQEEIKVEKTELPKRVVEEKKLEIKEKDYKKETVNKEFVADYKKENILKDSKVKNESSFASDFSVTPKVSYMHVSATVEKEDIGKTHEIVPEIEFTYKNHNLKFDYFESKTEKNSFNTLNVSNFDLNLKWYRLAYLYGLYNAKVGLAYNYLKADGNLFNLNDNEWYEFGNVTFPTIEVHLKNQENQFVAEYGGFYGKNDSGIKNAYEYYLTLGYRVFNNDSLVFNAGYKNRTISDEDIEFIFEGPVVGLSSRF